MKAKFVYESLEDILRPKSEEEIEQRLSPNEMLIKASELGLVKYVKKALKLGADVHAKDNAALILASENSHGEVVKILLEAIAPDEFNELLNDCYEMIQSFPNQFTLINEVGIHSGNWGRVYYGFDFHDMEVGGLDYTIEHNFKHNVVELFITDNKEAYNKNINNLGDLMFYFNLYEPINED